MTFPTIHLPQSEIHQNYHTELAAKMRGIERKKRAGNNHMYRQYNVMLERTVKHRTPSDGR